MYRIDFTEPAEEDLLAALRYISDVLKAPVVAGELLLETEQQFKVLESLPPSCPLVHDVLAMQGICLLSVNNYLVFYIVKESEKAISIIRFLHGRRDWATLLKVKDS